MSLASIISEYEADPRSEHFWIGGMATPDCPRRIEAWVTALPGVSEAAVSYPAAMAQVHYDQNVTDLEAISEAIERRGYRAALAGDDLREAPHGNEAEPSGRCLAAWVLVVALLLLEGVQSFLGLASTLYGAVAIGLALMALLGPGRRFAHRALRDVRFAFAGCELLAFTAVLLALLTGLPVLAGGEGPNLVAVGAVALALHLSVTGWALDALTRPLPDREPAEDSFENRKALASKLSIQRFADQMATVFSPLVLITALATALIWGLLPELLYQFSGGLPQYLPWTPVPDTEGDWFMGAYCAVAVLLCAAPWAIALAAPHSARNALNFAARHGFVLREAKLLQSLRDLTNVVFERTGGLSHNAPVVEDDIAMPGVDRARLLYWAASAESALDNPLATAIVDFARREDIDIGEAETCFPVPGKGIAALVDGQAVLVGRPSFLAAQGVDIEPLAHQIYVLGKEGRMPLLVAREKKLLGYFALRDPLRADSVRLTKILRRMGVWTVLLTGEEAGTAKTIGEQCGVAETIGNLDEKEKGEAVRKLKKETIGTIAYVGGDPREEKAWSHADMLVGLGGPGEHHIEVRKGQLKELLLAIQLGRGTFHKIIQNAFIGGGYNAVVVPFAMTGFLHPLLAQALMFGLCALVFWNSDKLLQFDAERFTANTLQR